MSNCFVPEDRLGRNILFKVCDKLDLWHLTVIVQRAPSSILADCIRARLNGVAKICVQNCLTHLNDAKSNCCLQVRKLYRKCNNSVAKYLNISLVELQNLTTLHIISGDSFQCFVDYASSLDSDNCLTELKLNLYHIDITSEWADSIRKCVRLKIFKLYAGSDVRNEERFLPSLGSLRELEQVTWIAKQALNPHSFYKHLKHIRKLRFEISWNSKDVQLLKHFENLEHIQIHLFDICMAPNVTPILNDVLTAVASSPSVTRLGIEAMTINPDALDTFTFYPTTIQALNRCKWTHMTLAKVFTARQTMEIIRNTPQLKYFIQKQSQLYSPAERNALYSLRHDDLYMDLHSTIVKDWKDGPTCHYEYYELDTDAEVLIYLLGML